MRVFVTGATGLIGSALCGALLGKGHAVTALSRAPDAARRLPLGARVVTGDPAVPGPWQEDLASCDACLHLAGEPIAEGRWTREKKRRLATSRVDSTERVAEVIAARGPTVLVQGSAVGFYGSRGDEVLDEASAAGQGFLADLSRRWEAAAAPAARRARVVLLRTGVVLARDGGALPRLTLPFKLFAGGPIGAGAFWFPWIHLRDEVGLALLALEDGRAAGPVNATAPEPVRNRELAGALGRALGRPSFVRTPEAAVRLALGEMAEAVLASQRVVPRRALELGYSFRFSTIGDALRDLLGR
ncbi:MAG TPA: TIGR01777 family oxidoreductase [Anaeromyxobacteraceae bacterium]|nr:TIGR01777 family oxidoreductase [Anaeromyxobacteraceae bacterium]